MSERDIMQRLAQPFEEGQVKTISKSGRSSQYATGEAVISRLNDVLGNGWSFIILDRWKETDYSGGDIFCVHGELSVEGFGVHQDFGQQEEMTPRNGGELSVGGLESAWKGAATDCLKRCARQLGVALYLYDKSSGSSAGQNGAARPPASAPRPAQNGGQSGKATDKQREFLWTLAKERGANSGDALQAWINACPDFTDIWLDNLTAVQASAVIDRLKLSRDLQADQQDWARSR